MVCLSTDIIRCACGRVATSYLQHEADPEGWGLATKGWNIPVCDQCLQEFTHDPYGLVAFVERWTL